jgi:hypothetical protein
MTAPLNAVDIAAPVAAEETLTTESPGRALWPFVG